MYMMTYSREKYRFEAPTPDMVNPEDLIHSLPRLCRFLGHVRCTMYSVAQHLVLTSNLVPQEFALPALLHDAPEIYTADLPRYLKRAAGMGGYKKYEDLAWRAVATRFGISRHLPEEVKLVDLRLVMTEWRDVMGNPTAECLPEQSQVEAYDFTIEPWETWRAELEFKRRLYELWTSS
jgi:uncharacterized protein